MDNQKVSVQEQETNGLIISKHPMQSEGKKTVINKVVLKHV
jgi:hypothetical protein